MPVAPMNAVIVWACSRGSKVIWAIPPAAMRTIIVSPTAREIASTKLATIPEIAAGTTILVETWRRVAPSAVGAVAELLRHGAIASSEIEATIGMSMTPTTSPAARTLNTPTSSAEVLEVAA